MDERGLGRSQSESGSSLERLVKELEELKSRQGADEDAIHAIGQEVQRAVAEGTSERQRLERAVQDAVRAAVLLHEAEDQAAASSGGFPVPFPPEAAGKRPARERAPWFRGIITGGGAVVVPLVWGAAAVMVVLLVLAGGAVAFPGMLTGHQAQAATRPHPRSLIDPAHWASADPGSASPVPPSQAAAVRRCRQDVDSDVIMVLLSGRHRRCRDRDGGQDEPAQPAVKQKGKGKTPRPHGTAAPVPVPAVTPPVPDPSPTCILAGKSHHCRGGEGDVPTVGPVVTPAATPDPDVTES